MSKENLYKQLHGTNDSKIVGDTLLYLTFNIDDVEWVEDCCLSLIDCDDDDISGLAITCLGHIARIHSKINKSKVIPLLVEKKGNSKLIGRVEDAIDDINQFVND